MKASKHVADLVIKLLKLNSISRMRKRHEKLSILKENKGDKLRLKQPDRPKRMPAELLF